VVTCEVRVFGLAGEEEAGMGGVLSGVETGLVGMSVVIVQCAVDARCIVIRINEIIALDQAGHGAFFWI
jgi:hypothetical protein